MQVSWIRTLLVLSQYITLFPSEGNCQSDSNVTIWFRVGGIVAELSLKGHCRAFSGLICTGPFFYESERLI
jgi:hypothetical protein